MAKNCLKIYDFSRETIFRILNRSAELKNMSKSTGMFQPLKGKAIGLFFEKSSTRTRVSFEVGIGQLGGNAIFLSPRDIQINRGETVEDTARVLARYLDCLVIRTFSHEGLEEWAAYSRIPVINGLTDLHHPCQGLADIFTIMEVKDNFDGKVTYIGDANNVLNSLMEAAALVGLDITICSPEGYGPDRNLLATAREKAKESGGAIVIEGNPAEAVKNADFIYTDVWTSMGQENEREERLEKFQGFQVNSELLALAKPDVKILHCLPAKRGEEITAEVLEGKHAVVFDQAENRLHVQKAILIELLGR